MIRVTDEVRQKAHMLKVAPSFPMFYKILKEAFDNSNKSLLLHTDVNAVFKQQGISVAYQEILNLFE